MGRPKKIPYKERKVYCKTCIIKIPHQKTKPKLWTLDVCPNCHALSRYDNLGNLTKLKSAEMERLIMDRKADFNKLIEKLKQLNEQSVKPK